MLFSQPDSYAEVWEKKKKHFKCRCALTSQMFGFYWYQYKVHPMQNSSNICFKFFNTSFDGTDDGDDEYLV